jgi:hypothetical protein
MGRETPRRNLVTVEPERFPSYAESGLFPSRLQWR